LQRRLFAYANEKLANRTEEQVIQVHAELPPERVTPTLAGWLKRLEPIGHGNPEPIFLGRAMRVTAPVRVMKERHIRLEVVPADVAGFTRSISMVGWGLAARAAELALGPGSIIDVVYKIRENDHPQFGGLQLEISGIALPGEQVLSPA
jgi:single-stranded-DNA-specific exonuclease